MGATTTKLNMPEKAKITAVSHFSSGITSWAASKRYAEAHGTEGMVLLFADTLIEDEDNYRFLHEAAENIGAPLVIIKDGRSPWEVMRKKRIIGNSRIDPCSEILKRKLLANWVKENTTDDTLQIFGIGWDEIHRLERLKVRLKHGTPIAPLCDPPYLTKRNCIQWAESEGIKAPRMYGMGFPHANCGGFCIKAGQASFAILLKNFPERYAMHEAEEESMRELLGDHSIMKKYVNGERQNLAMKQLRETIEAKQEIDEFDFGGCGCALE
jgi:3'-phosphoadenosine 5'-phosphosulfate sulfotransferase (PAPS reductase)/FAD synthetase